MTRMSVLRSRRWVAKLCRSVCMDTRLSSRAACAAVRQARSSWRVVIGWTGCWPGNSLMITTMLRQKTVEVVKRLSNDEVDAIRRRRPGMRASLACEGLVLTDEEETLLDDMEEEKLLQEQRDQRVLDFIATKTTSGA